MNNLEFYKKLDALEYTAQNYNLGDVINLLIDFKIELWDKLSDDEKRQFELYYVENKHLF